MKKKLSYKFSSIRQYLRGIKLALRGKKLFEVNKDSYCEDGLATNHVTDFMRDEFFMKNYSIASKNTNMEKLSHRILFRAYILTYFSDYALSLFGDKKGCIIELGTHKALMAKMIVLNSSFKKNIDTLYLFDTFKGIPTGNLKKDEIEHVKNLNSDLYSENTYDYVKNLFVDYPFVNIVKGELPNSLNQSNIDLENIKFLHIDLNNSFAEIESIKILYEKLLIGAPVILDDYCYSENYRDQKTAWDIFIKTKNLKILSLPTGQGIFFKI